MHIHILGICGTFMGGIAAIARQLGHTVTGSDDHVYPPMSTLLESLDVEIGALDDLTQLDPAPDIVIVGNALSRGNPQVEAILERGIAYTSGPQWLGEQVLRHKWVLAVAGTHGKTTTASMLTHILEDAGYHPGFLIGGVLEQFQASARLTDSMFFVIEADEYDTAFFDKRSKFVHYHPNTLGLNNLEFDHADIFPDLAAIQRQVHHVVRTVPGNGAVIWPADSVALADTIKMGCWSETQLLHDQNGWEIANPAADGSAFDVRFQGLHQGRVSWGLLGVHNMQNALMAIACAHHAGVPAPIAIEALSAFQAPKRRLEKIYSHAELTLYDDFAHHPTAMGMTLQGLRAHAQNKPVWAIIEPRSNTMKAGVHKEQLVDALAPADQVIAFDNQQLHWSLEDIAKQAQNPWYIEADLNRIITFVTDNAPADAHIVMMSNGGFGGLRETLAKALAERPAVQTDNAGQTTKGA
ncbi:MAG: UDP-N-acetylmuramate:L-alanyl-gamma-D-glutamyl-meso-diaminopimelate ligase [Idiomarina sp.]|nr:UDP-N-acetylmuramate:L-alanyl-gamma-D-glutamyl-meso-diaminopimelate ligase [Idiomarina sp.]